MKRIYFKKDTLRRLSYMKNNVLYLLLLCASTTIFSCGNTGSEEAPDADIQTNDIALKAFAQAHNALMDSLLATTSPNRQEDELDTAKVEKIVEDIKENFANQLGVNIAQDAQTRFATENSALEVLNMDPDSIMPYLKERVSPEFYNICNQIMETGVSPVTEDDIINSKGLTQKEKISALLFLPALSYNDQFKLNDPSTRSQQTCLNTYNSSRNSCTIRYVAATALSCAGGIVTAVAGVTLATYEYDNCMDDALLSLQTV